MTEVNTFEGNAPESQEYIDAMVAAADAAEGITPESTEQQQQPAEEQRPEWLPEKFKSPEAMAEAYAALEKRLSQNSEGSNESGKNEENNDDSGNVPESIESAEKIVQEKGLDYSRFTAEYNSEGGLSEESFKQLEKAGIPRNIVESYITGLELQAENTTKAAYSIVGGEESYREMIEWAGDNLSASEIAEFNNAVASTNGLAKMAIRGLYAQYINEAGSEPNLVSGKSTSNKSDVFRSVEELSRAMSDSRYGTDPAYTKDIEAKLSRSNILE